MVVEEEEVVVVEEEEEGKGVKPVDALVAPVGSLQHWSKAVCCQPGAHTGGSASGRMAPSQKWGLSGEGAQAASITSAVCQERRGMRTPARVKGVSGSTGTLQCGLPTEEWGGCTTRRLSTPVPES